MQLSCSVRVERWKVHSKYGKRYRYHRKFMAHDHRDCVLEGDVVRISPCRPISKRKAFVVQKILRRLPAMGPNPDASPPEPEVEQSAADEEGATSAATAAASA